MFNLGFSELVLLGLIALIFIGPNQLPEVARTIGRLLNEWKRATSDFQSSLTTHITEDLHKRREETQAPQVVAQTDEEFHKHIRTPGSGFESAPDLPVGAHPVSESSSESDPEKKS